MKRDLTVIVAFIFLGVLAAEIMKPKPKPEPKLEIVKPIVKPLGIETEYENYCAKYDAKQREFQLRLKVIKTTYGETSDEYLQAQKEFLNFLDWGIMNEREIKNKLINIK